MRFILARHGRTAYLGNWNDFTRDVKKLKEYLNFTAPSATKNTFLKEYPLLAALLIL